MLHTYHNISAEDLDLFTLTDDPMQAVAIVQDYCQAREQAIAEAAATIAVPYAEQLTAEGTRRGMPVTIPPLGKRKK
jgi:hypothetical protein